MAGVHHSGGVPVVPLEEQGDKHHILQTIWTIWWMVQVTALVVGVYVWGHYGYSVAWVFLFVFVRAVQKEFNQPFVSKMGYARHAAKDERSAIQSRVWEELSWVRIDSMLLGPIY